MHKTMNDLPEKVRTHVVTLLQERLAEAVADKALWLVEAHAQPER